MSKSVTLIATDLFPEIEPNIRSAVVAITIHQRPRTQGRMAFEVLYRFLADRACPAPLTKLAPYIVMQSNLDLLVNQLPGALEQDETRSLGELRSCVFRSWWVRSASDSRVLQGIPIDLLGNRSTRYP